MKRRFPAGSGLLSFFRFRYGDYALPPDWLDLVVKVGRGTRWSHPPPPVCPPPPNPQKPPTPSCPGNPTPPPSDCRCIAWGCTGVCCPCLAYHAFSFAGTPTGSHLARLFPLCAKGSPFAARLFPAALRLRPVGPVAAAVDRGVLVRSPIRRQSEWGKWECAHFLAQNYRRHEIVFLAGNDIWDWFDEDGDAAYPDEFTQVAQQGVLFLRESLNSCTPGAACCRLHAGSCTWMLRVQ